MRSDPPLELAVDQVQVWLVDLRVAPLQLETLATLLSADERERASRFRFATHRRRFIAGRGVLRSLLAERIDRNPSSLLFTYGTAGKPELADPAGSGVQFNVSHADDVALIALARQRRVGVDVERVRSAGDLERLAARFFSPSEAADFMRLPPTARRLAFYTCWSRKEAFLKARGVGLSGNLKGFSVTLRPEDPARIRQLGPELEHDSSWTLEDVDVPGGYVGALAVEGSGWQIAAHRWEHPRS